MLSWTCIRVITDLHFHTASCTHTLRALQMSDDIIERVKRGEVDAVTAEGADLSARTHWGETLLHVASRCGHRECPHCPGPRCACP
jgi:ankyrin repeat protein